MLLVRLDWLQQHQPGAVMLLNSRTGRRWRAADPGSFSRTTESQWAAGDSDRRHARFTKIGSRDQSRGEAEDRRAWLLSVRAPDWAAWLGKRPCEVMNDSYQFISRAVV